MMTKGWHLTFRRQGQIYVPLYLFGEMLKSQFLKMYVPLHLYGENVEKSFSQNVL